MSVSDFPNGLSAMSSLPELSSTPAFACSRCGLCCQHLNMNPLYEALDRGDGVCMHYDSATRRCGIYEQRPLICRVDDSYIHFAAVMSREQYNTANLQACQQLIDRFGTDQRISIINNQP